MKCPSCTTGTLEPSGSHVYCNNCSFTQFTVTPDYINAACTLLGVLYSNVKYRSAKAFRISIVDSIATHIPLLHEGLQRITAGREGILGLIESSIKTQAINLQIESFTHNPASKELTCNCGDSNISLKSVGEAVCLSCGAQFKSDGDTYRPKFECSCGCIRYEDIGAGLWVCASCSKAYAGSEELRL